MSFSKQDELILKHQKIHNDLEESKKKASIESGKDLIAAQLKKDKALSDDAYPDNAHFIYEIIQNAEDSSYVKNNFAELKFLLLDKGILILSNQDGFTDEDIKSICYMSSSDKTAKKDQFIGEKGLGFRSVFKITDTPCISSNGYKFFFDKKQSYEKPFLIKDYEEVLPDEFHKTLHTTIFLPYSISDYDIHSLEEDFKNKIKPELILFLKKLQSINISKNNTDITSVQKNIEKHNLFDLCKITNKTISKEYYLIRKDINIAPNCDEVINEKGKRKGVKSRELVLAFPSTNYQNETNLFAFLPTDIDTRLNFIIQADFLLDTNRGHILENEWNRNLIKEIKIFVLEVIENFKNDEKLKYNFLKYYIQNVKSNNKYIDGMYNQILNELHSRQIILTDNDTWQKPKDIILIDNDTEIDTKYLKILYGNNFEKVNKNFEFDEYFIKKFNIKRINKYDIIQKICSFFDGNDLNNFSKKDILYFTKFLSKCMADDSKANSFFEKVKSSLPIIPKYKNQKKFYMHDKIHISKGYHPEFMIEDMAEKKDFDFSEYNFLSEEYLYEKNENTKNFLLKIVGEQKEHNNEKTIDFLINNEGILHKYLALDIKQNYKKILEFIQNNYENNKEKISKIKLLMLEDGTFCDALNKNIYFSNESETKLDILHHELYNVVRNEEKYKKLLENIFKVKNADIVNIIIHEYIPWFKKNIKKRDNSNDEKLIKYTKSILNNYKRFNDEQKKEIVESLYFMSINDKQQYLDAKQMYLPGILDEKSIEHYLRDKSYFDFLDDNLYGFDKSDEVQIREFKFIKQKIKPKDTKNFIKFIKDNLSLKDNIEALNLIVENLEKDKKYEELKNFIIFSQNEDKHKIAEIYFENIGFGFDYLNDTYDKKKLEVIKDYFLSPFALKPFIDLLKNTKSHEEAQKIYEYLDKNFSNYKEIKKEFENSKLIVGSDSKKFYPDEVTWREEKSNFHLFALSSIYKDELQNFFIKKIQIAQSKSIKQVIEQIYKIKSRDKEYYNLIVDLNTLISDNNEIDRYYNSFGVNTPSEKKDIKKFIIEKEQVFILDDSSKNGNADFYFNDLNIKNIPEQAKKIVFSIYESSYTLGHFNNLIEHLKIRKISTLKKTHDPINKNNVIININDYRQILHFCYDFLFSKEMKSYKNLETKVKDLEQINLLDEVIFYDDIIVKIKLGDEVVEIDSEKYFFEDKQLKLVDINDLFRLLAKELAISDKAIKDFYNEVIKNKINKEKYYENENIKEKQNFPLEISTKITQEEKINNTNCYSEMNQKCEEKSSTIDYISKKEDIVIDAETQREERRKKGINQIGDYEKDIEDSSHHDRTTEPSLIVDNTLFQQSYHEKQMQKMQEVISSKLSNISQKTKHKITLSAKFGHEETKNKFKRKDWYLGQCQICGFTFKTSEGNHFERFTWTDFGRGSWTSEQTQMAEYNIIGESSSLCLCSRCYSILKHGGQFKANFLTHELKQKLKLKDYTYDNFIEDIEADKLMSHPKCFKEHVEWKDMYFLSIELNNNEENIYFTEEHLIAFFTFLKS